jgi:hypothetical protein
MTVDGLLLNLLTFRFLACGIDLIGQRHFLNTLFVMIVIMRCMSSLSLSVWLTSSHP